METKKITETLKSVFFMEDIFNELGEKNKLILIKYNNPLQDF